MLFADDTAAYLATTKPAESKQLQDDLDTHQEWEIDWNMEYNPGKCKVMQITWSRSPIPTQYSLHGQSLEVVNSARYLGVDIGSHHSWKDHITRITNNANKSLGFLRRNLKAKSIKLREIAIVHPSWNILHQSGTHTYRKTSKELRWFRDGLLDGSWVTTQPNQVSQTCWEDWAGAPFNSGVLTHGWSYFLR